MKKDDLIQKSDNTKVDVGTAELPRWKAPFVPNYYEGEREYKKGNYTNPHAKAYAEKISGKVESVSPEFELLGALGLKGLSKLFKNSFKPVNNSHFLSPEGIYPNTTRNFTGTPFHKKRLINGSYKKVGYQVYPNNSIEQLYKAYNMEDPLDVAKMAKDLGLSDNSVKRFIDGKWSKVNFGNQGFTSGKTFNTYRGSKIKSQEYFDILLPHEVHHGLSRGTRVLYKREKPPIDIENLRKYRQSIGKSEKIIDEYFDVPEIYWDEIAARGTQILDYFGFTSPNQKLTGDMLKEASKRYTKDTGVDNNMTDFFKLIGNNWDEMADWINKYSTSIITPIAGGYIYEQNKR